MNELASRYSASLALDTAPPTPLGPACVNVPDIASCAIASRLALYEAMSGLRLSMSFLYFSRAASSKSARFQTIWATARRTSELELGPCRLARLLLFPALVVVDVVVPIPLPLEILARLGRIQPLRERLGLDALAL